MKCPVCGFNNIAGAEECDSCQSPLSNEYMVPKKGMERRILEGTIAELSPRKALTIAPGEPLAKAVELMRGAKVGSVLVVEGQELVGVLSERELLLRTAESTSWERTPVKEIMRARPTLLREDDQVAEAFHRMALSNHRHVPVRLKNGDLGVVSARDLLRYLCQ